MVVRISDDARAAWKTIAQEQGVSVTALIEALGTCLGELEHLPPLVRDAIAAARKIDAERRYR